MPGISHVEPEPRYSASSWYTNVNAALMGIPSTAQFVDKYHHIIGKKFTAMIFTFGRSTRESGESGNRFISNREEEPTLFNERDASC